MKNIKSTLDKFLSKSGYHYKNVEDIPKFDSPEVDFLLKAEMNEKLENGDKILEHVKTIENCVVFFTILQIAAMIIYTILFFVIKAKLTF